MLRKLSERADRCAAEIDSRNRRNLVLFSDGALLIAAAAFAASLIWPYYRSFLLSHGLLLLYTVALFFFARFCQQKQLKHIRAAMYLAFAPYMAGAVLLGSFFDPSRPAVTIIIFLCVLPLFIIDKPRRVVAYQAGFAAVFVVCAYFAKPLSVFYDDVFYLPIYLSFGVGANILVMTDKIESAENVVRIRHESEHDALTELLNRKSGEEKLQAMFRAQIHGTFAVADIDNFKSFNDRYGHQAGDAVLCEVSRAMRSVFRASDIIWRLGGDEFAIYAVNMLDPATCRKRFEALTERIAAAQIPPYGTLSIRVSVGCVICRGERLDFEQIYQASDAALYEAKNAGKGTIVIREQAES